MRNFYCLCAEDSKMDAEDNGNIPKVGDDCHLTGKFIGFAHVKSNITQDGNIFHEEQYSSISVLDIVGI